MVWVDGRYSRGCIPTGPAEFGAWDCTLSLFASAVAFRSRPLRPHYFLLSFFAFFCMFPFYGQFCMLSMACILVFQWRFWGGKCDMAGVELPFGVQRHGIGRPTCPPSSTCAPLLLIYAWQYACKCLICMITPPCPALSSITVPLSHGSPGGRGEVGLDGKVP